MKSSSKHVLRYFVILLILSLILFIHPIFKRIISVDPNDTQSSIHSRDEIDNQNRSIYKTNVRHQIHHYMHIPHSEVIASGGFAEYRIAHDLPKLQNNKATDFAIENALSVGAKGKITLYIVDVDENPLSEVAIHVTCGKSERNYEVRTYATSTDNNGLASLEVISSRDMNITVSKEGYYESKYKYVFLKPFHKCVTHKCWIPWNPTLKMTLKPVRNPTKRVIKKAKLIIPSDGDPYGFDCTIGDLIEPYGKGKISDFNITVFSDSTLESMMHCCYTNEVLFTATSDEAGFQLIPFESYSNFPFNYEAPVDGYKSSLFFSRRIWGPSSQCVQVIDPFEDGYYVVFRSKNNNEIDNTNNPMKYGKILPSQFLYGYDFRSNANTVQFMYYYSTTFDDRNMEGEDDLSEAWW